MDASVTETTAAYEGLVFEIESTIKQIKKVHGRFEMAHDEQTKRLKEDKEQEIRSQTESSKQKRHEELLNIQMRQLQLTETLKESEHDRMRTSRSYVKLHPIKPMQFDGDPKQFSSFMSNWSATVDQQDLTDEVKLRYLQDALGPGPRNTIISLKSGSQYGLAISMLKKKYGSEVTVKKAYYDSLENLGDIKNANDISALRHFSENVEIYCHGLQECGVDVNSQDFIFYLVFRKLPDTIRLEFSKRAGGMEYLNLKTLLNMLNDHVNIASSVGYVKELSVKGDMKEEQCFYESSKPLKSFNNRSHWNQRKSGKYSQPQFPSKPNTALRKPNSPCVFCKKPNHWCEDCRRYPTRDTRLKQLGSCCLKCFKTNHSTDSCYKKTWCPHCRTENEHNRSLCPKKFDYQAGGNDNQGPSRTTNTNSEERQSTFKNSENAFIATDNEYIVFPTAMAYVKPNSRSTPRQKCLIAFDTMSSRSYVTNAVAKQLGLTKKFYEQLSVHTFASTEPKPISSYRSDIGIETIDGGEITIEVSVVNSIEAKVMRAPIESKAIREQLQYFTLADPRPIRAEVSPVDILIGNDFYDIIVQSRRHEVAHGKLWLKESLLGWLITGKATSTENHSDLDACNMSFYAFSTRQSTESFARQNPVIDKIDFISNY